MTNDEVRVSVAPELTEIVRPGVLALADLTVVGRTDALDGALRAAVAGLCRRPPVRGDAVRRMYSRVGLDPTRRRPSSEALLRRVRRGEPLPRINVVVDVCNWCSLELQLPYGVYDRDRISGGVCVRLGQPGEAYAGIGKDDVHVDGRLVLADTLGPFGNPTSDSARTRVTASTTRILTVIFAPRETDEESLAAALELTSSRLVRFTGGRETGRVIL